LLAAAFTSIFIDRHKYSLDVDKPEAPL